MAMTRTHDHVNLPEVPADAWFALADAAQFFDGASQTALRRWIALGYISEEDITYRPRGKGMTAAQIRHAKEVMPARIAELKSRRATAHKRAKSKRHRTHTVDTARAADRAAARTAEADAGGAAA